MALLLPSRRPYGSSFNFPFFRVRADISDDEWSKCCVPPVAGFLWWAPSCRRRRSLRLKGWCVAVRHNKRSNQSLHNFGLGHHIAPIWLQQNLSSSPFCSSTPRTQTNRCITRFWATFQCDNLHTFTGGVHFQSNFGLRAKFWRSFLYSSHNFVRKRTKTLISLLILAVGMTFGPTSDVGQNFEAHSSTQVIILPKTCSGALVSSTHFALWNWLLIRLRIDGKMLTPILLLKSPFCLRAWQISRVIPYFSPVGLTIDPTSDSGQNFDVHSSIWRKILPTYLQSSSSLQR